MRLGRESLQLDLFRPLCLFSHQKEKSMQLPMGLLDTVYVSPFILGGYVIIGAGTKKFLKALLIALAWCSGMNLLGAIMGPELPGASFWLVQFLVATFTTGITFGITSRLKGRRTAGS
jgi:hypothetical protein